MLKPRLMMLCQAMMLFSLISGILCLEIKLEPPVEGVTMQEMGSAESAQICQVTFSHGSLDKVNMRFDADQDILTWNYTHKTGDYSDGFLIMIGSHPKRVVILFDKIYMQNKTVEFSLTNSTTYATATIYKCQKKATHTTHAPYYQPMIFSQNKNTDGSWNVKFSISFNIKIINLTTFTVELFKDSCLSDDAIQTETITAADRYHFSFKRLTPANYCYVLIPKDPYANDESRCICYRTVDKGRHKCRPCEQFYSPFVVGSQISNFQSSEATITSPMVVRIVQKEQSNMTGLYIGLACAPIPLVIVLVACAYYLRRCREHPNKENVKVFLVVAEDGPAHAEFCESFANLLTKHCHCNIVNSIDHIKEHSVLPNVAKKRFLLHTIKAANLVLFVSSPSLYSIYQQWQFEFREVEIKRTENYFNVVFNSLNHIQGNVAVVNLEAMSLFDRLPDAESFTIFSQFPTFYQFLQTLVTPKHTAFFNVGLQLALETLQKSIEYIDCVSKLQKVVDYFKIERISCLKSESQRNQIERFDSGIDEDFTPRHCFKIRSSSERRNNGQYENGGFLAPNEDECSTLSFGQQMLDINRKYENMIALEHSKFDLSFTNDSFPCFEEYVSIDGAVSI